MKLRSKFIFAWLIVIMTSCAYYPQVVDVPLINHKNDLRVDAGISIIPTVRATVSYGLTDRVAIQASGNYQWNDVYYWQGAAGLFKKNERVVKEMYAGFGYGLGNAYNDANPGNLKGDYQIYFVQFNYGKIDDKFAHMDYGIGLKTGYFHSNFTDMNYYEIYPNGSVYKLYRDESILFEPTAFIRLGGERLKFNLKIGSSFIYKFTHQNIDYSLPHAYLNLGLGVSYQL